MDNELLLYDRIAVIRDTITKYGEENFYISFSGGKDSTIVHHLIDMALPDNKIPRVYLNTGIEYIDVVKHVRKMAEADDRIVVYDSKVNIKQMLEQEGYPFKSKYHSRAWADYQKGNRLGVNYYEGKNVFHERNCPPFLKYQFETTMPFKLSGKCCDRLKKDTAHRFEKETGKRIRITGLMREEGGQRNTTVCILKQKGKVQAFNPLAVVTKEWEEWLINKEKILLCKLYYEPFNFQRTGCKGCPFDLRLQEDLETMERYLPNERKQCEIIWKPVYEEYRRLGYRLKKDEQLKLL